MSYSLTKIKQVKELIKQAQISLPQKTAYIINDFDNSSDEAQNSFLKLLEEPQKNIVFIINVKKLENLLPTVQSRCQIVHFKKVINKQSTQSDFFSIKQSLQLREVSNIKTREQAIEFLETIINSETDPYKMKKADDCLSAINANCNVNLQLSNFVIRLNLSS